MGVYGLHRFITGSSCPKTLLSWDLPPKKIPPDKNSLLCIDGNSFVYYVYFRHLHWICGGQYQEFVMLIELYLGTLVEAGWKIEFFFDGPAPTCKNARRIENETEKIQRMSKIWERLNRESHVLFHQSLATLVSGQLSKKKQSHASRLGHYLYEHCVHSPQTLTELKRWDRQGSLPPLAMIYCEQRLRQGIKGVKMVSSLGEADIEVARRARLSGGYALSQDSDYYLFHNVRYISLDSLQWDLSEVNEETLDTLGKVSIQRIRCVAYHTDEVAQFLNLPITAMPLFGSLLGNDFMRGQDVHNKVLHRLIPKWSRYPKGTNMTALARYLQKLTSQLDQKTMSSNSLTRFFLDSIGYLLSKKDFQDLSATLLLAISQYVDNANTNTATQVVSKKSNILEGVPSFLKSRYEKKLLSPKVLNIVVHKVFWCSQSFDVPVRVSSWVISREIRCWIVSLIYFYDPSPSNGPPVEVWEFIRKGDHVAKNRLLPVPLEKVKESLKDPNGAYKTLSESDRKGIFTFALCGTSSKEFLDVQPKFHILCFSLCYFIKKSSECSENLKDYEVMALIAASFTFPKKRGKLTITPNAVLVLARFQTIVLSTTLLHQTLCLNNNSMPKDIPLLNGIAFHSFLEPLKMGKPINSLMQHSKQKQIAQNIYTLFTNNFSHLILQTSETQGTDE